MTTSDANALAAMARIWADARKSQQAELARVQWERS